MTAKPRLGVFKFASCDGCQVSLFNLDETLLRLAERVEIAFFLEATSRVQPGPYDVSLVEGSIATAADAERIQAIRAESRMLVTIGACATAGGIQALRNGADTAEWVSHVYARPEWLDVLPTSTPISDHVKVDAEISGCPVSSGQVLRVLLRALLGASPDLSGDSVCSECKRQGHACVMVTRGTPCMGPVTRAGCGALCPGLGRDCYACFGPSDDPNPAALAAEFRRRGLSPREIALRFRGICGASRPFRELADALEAEADA